MRFAIWICIVSNWSAWAPAEELGAHEQKALSQTQDLLRDRAARQQAVKKDPKAKKVDDALLNLLGGDQKLKDDVYDLAADVFGNVVRSAGGDSRKMESALKDFQR